MVKKTEKNAPAKKPAAKKKTAGKASAARGSAKKAAAPALSAPPPRNLTPLYLLVILGLLAVIVILANLHIFDDSVSPQRGAVHDRNAERAEKKTEAQEAAVDPGKTDRPVIEEKKKEITGKAPGVETSQLKIFLIRYDDRTERSTLNPVLRAVKGEPTVEQALEALIKGPTSSEIRRGLLSAIPAGLRVRSVTVKNRIAEIDFNGAIEANASGSILIGRLDQIVYTATELRGVDSVIIKINGRRRQFIGSDGLSIGGPMHRRQ